MSRSSNAPGLPKPVLFMGLSLAACPSEPPNVPESSATSAPVFVATASEAPTAEPTQTAAPNAPADTRVRDACVRLCERKTKSCSNLAEGACEADCSAHEAKSKGCELEVSAALQCQAAAKDSPCGNFAASECTDAFVRMQRCQRGEPPEKAISTKQELPAGWQNVKVDAWGVALMFPPGAAVDPQAKSPTWRASLEGAEYEAREFARPKGELNDQAMVKLVIGHVGVTCQQDMKINGRVDSERMVSTRFETRCGKAARLFGKLRIDANRVLSLVVRGPAAHELREAFLEGVR